MMAVSTTLPAPFRVYSGCDYDGCFWAIVSTDQDMTGWYLSVDSRGEPRLHSFELGEAGQLSETELTINPHVQLPSDGTPGVGPGLARVGHLVGAVLSVSGRGLVAEG
jgi:hypothetical protein